MIPFPIRGIGNPHTDAGSRTARPEVVDRNRSGGRSLQRQSDRAQSPSGLGILLATELLAPLRVVTDAIR